MALEFSSQQELFQRLRPALRAKKQELSRMGYFYIREIDVWNYLKQTKWQQAHDLMLCDIVDDIFNVSTKALEEFVKEELLKAKPISSLEVI